MQQIKQTLLNNKGKVAVLLIAAIVAVVAWLIYFFAISFSVASVTPTSDKVPVGQPFIRIDFTKEVEPDGIQISLQPSSALGTIEPKGKSVIVNLYDVLEAGEEYTLAIENIASKSGVELTDYTYTFTPVDDSSLLTKEAMDVILFRQNQKPDAMQDPAFNKTPITGDNFLVKSYLDSAPNDQAVVRLEVTIYLHRQLIEELGGYETAVGAVNAQANQAIKDAGIDASKYEIEYKVQNS